MPKIRFFDLSLLEKKTVYWLADEAATLTPTITAAASHIGEIWAAASFMETFPKGTAAHAALANRLRLGDQSTESILDCIERAASSACAPVQKTDAELDSLFAGHEGTAMTR